MKICMLTDAWTPIWGGGQEHVWQTAKRLIEKYDCDIDFYTRNLIGVTAESGRPDLLKRFRVIKVGRPRHFSDPIGRVEWLIRGPFAIASGNRKANYSLIHSHGYSDALVGKIASIITRKPQIHTVHGSNMLDLGKKTVGYYIVNFLLTKIKFAKEISVTKSFLRYHNVNKEILVIPNGVDLSEFSEVKHKEHRVFTILCVSRLDPAKGISILEQAVKEIPNCKLNFVSGRKRTVADFASADCYVLPSVSEGLPIVLLEAMAAKLPIVSTDVGDCRDLVEKSNCGYVVKPGNVEALFSGIKKMMSTTNRDQMGNNGYDLVKRHYTWEIITRQIYEVYCRL